MSGAQKGLAKPPCCRSIDTYAEACSRCARLTCINHGAPFEHPIREHRETEKWYCDECYAITEASLDIDVDDLVDQYHNDLLSAHGF